MATQRLETYERGQCEQDDEVLGCHGEGLRVGEASTLLYHIWLVGVPSASSAARTRVTGPFGAS